MRYLRILCQVKIGVHHTRVAVKEETWDERNGGGEEMPAVYLTLGYSGPSASSGLSPPHV